MGNELEDIQAPSSPGGRRPRAARVATVAPGPRSRGEKKVECKVLLDESVDADLRVHLAYCPRGVRRSDEINKAVRKYLVVHGRGLRTRKLADELAENLVTDTDAA
jgi:hypothetical protein